MNNHLHLDFETFSEAELKDVGAYRYAFDPSTEILCAAMALGDENPSVWFDGVDEDFPTNFEAFWTALQDPSVLIYCHNAAFEMAICQVLLQKTWGIPCPDLSRFRCTMSLARRASLPAKLETLAEVLGLQAKKDNRGKALIKKFSVMQSAKKPTKKFPDGQPPRRIRPEDEPEAFAEFCAYCAQDVRVEQEVSRKLHYFDSDPNNSNYSLDAVINARGVPVNLAALRHAQLLIEEETELVTERFRTMFGFNPTQGDVFLGWLKENGCPLPDLQKETIETFLENADRLEAESVNLGVSKIDSLAGSTPAVLALRMKQSIAYASIKKVATMIACAGPHDNRIRGMLNHHGATTGRWTASLVQFQNMKRPLAKFRDDGSEVKGWTEDAYRMICEGCSRFELELMYGPVLETISSCIRHFVHDTL